MDDYRNSFHFKSKRRQNLQNPKKRRIPPISPCLPGGSRPPREAQKAADNLMCKRFAAASLAWALELANVPADCLGADTL
ncbi:hypothetical protein Poly51_04070 [Rubripirellula tenax]|uniref:Uncharacterized protein n=1 Tax=Rubripirellula tenax TaxID=2528015 RepID=A0A5C6FHV4_9BACT|nr:hypothetical protein Poly51_04070 [Rubripirellula tenax]